MKMTQEEWDKTIRDKVSSSREKIALLDMMELDVEESSAEDNTVTFRFVVKDWYLNQFGMINGAMIAAMMEISCGTLANALAGDGDTVATDLNINYIRSLNVGKYIYARVRLIKQGRFLIRTCCELADQKAGRPAVTASCSSFNAIEK